MAPQNNAPLPDGSAFGDAGRGQQPLGDRPPPSFDRMKPAQRPKQPWLWGLRMRTKILAVLLVPAIVAAALGVLALTDRLSSASRFDSVEQGVEVTISAVGLANELERERDLMTSLIAASRNRDRTAIQQQKAKVDDAVNQFRANKDAVGGQTEAVQEAYTRANDRLDSIGPLRSVVEGTQFPEDAAFNSYTSIIDTLLQLQREIAASGSDPTVIALARSAEAIGRAHEQVGQERSMILAAVLSNGGTFPVGQLDEVQAASARREAAIADFLNVASADDTTLYSDTVAGPEVDGRERLLQIAVARGQQNAPLQINYDEWDHESGVTMDLLSQVQLKLLDKERASAQDSGAQYRNAALLSAIPVLLALVLTVLFALLVARSILRQIRVLRKTALEVADTRLPEAVQRILADPNPIEASKNAIPPVPIYTNEEIGQLARSFDVVHDQAVRLAAEQAVLRDNVNAMFVNLSRRSQTLVERQLSLIDRLEQDEQDPDQLSNLFELDHLATRMRRNSENLLVLSGSGFGKRLNRPVAVGELVGAAVSEVEQYARIEVTPPPDIAVQGWVVNDLIHLIAELLDNATAFSEPQTKVSVRIAKTRNQELAIQISDRGVGMSEEDIAEANDRLSNPPDLDVAVSRRMGLYVVARLAKRHNIRVRLHTSEDIDGGTRATIAVPPDLVTAMPQQQARSAGIAGAFGTGGMSPLEVSSPSMSGGFPPIGHTGPQPMVTSWPGAGHTGSQPAVGAQPERQPQGMADLTELLPPAAAHDSADAHHALADDATGHDPANAVSSEQRTTEFRTADLHTAAGLASTDDPSADEQAAEFGAAAHSSEHRAAELADEPAATLEPESELESTGQRFVPKVGFDGAEHAGAETGEAPPWAGSDSDDLRQLVAAWQRQGMQEQEEIQAERTGVGKPVATATNGHQPGHQESLSATMADFEAEDQAGPALASVHGDGEQQWPQPGPLGTNAPPTREMDAPTERLPIYEAVLSQWFTADESDADLDPALAIDNPLGAGGPPSYPPDDAAEPEPEPEPDEPKPAKAAGPAAGSTGHGLVGTPLVPSPHPRQPAAEPAPEPAPEPEPVAESHPSHLLDGPAEHAGLPKRKPGARAWKSPADDGWTAAQSLLEQKNDDVTSAGLPKRKPRAHLVPGSAQPQQQAQPPRLPGMPGMPSVPPRSADSTRTRMSSFQKGIRRGRHARVDALAERLTQDSPNAGTNGHDEGRP